MTRLYMAYGSNLNKGQMAYRCPTAKPIGSAKIYGWELAFRGVADIIKSKDPNMFINVGLWEIEPEDELSLDAYEGVSSGLYKQIVIGGVMTYKMNREYFAPPSNRYFNTILEGYKDFDMDTTFLYDAVSWSIWEYENADYYAIG